MMDKERKVTDKERLEMIKDIQKRIKECQEKGQNVSNLHSDYIDWLIEQAEKAEQLELEINNWRAEVQKWQKFYKESEKSHLETKELLHFMINENKRLAKESIKYRELLSDIANLAYYKEQDGEYYENLLKQVMLFARRTLEGYKNN